MKVLHTRVLMATLLTALAVGCASFGIGTDGVKPETATERWSAALVDFTNLSEVVTKLQNSAAAEIEAETAAGRVHPLADELEATGDAANDVVQRGKAFIAAAVLSFDPNNEDEIRAATATLRGIITELQRQITELQRLGIQAN